MMDVHNLVYPVVAFSRGMLFPARNSEDLTTCSATALRSGYFRSVTIVDSNGRMFSVKEAKAIGGVGPFWGYNIFLNRKIKVELQLEEEASVELPQFLEKVMHALRGRQEWNSREDYFEVVKGVKESGSIAEVIRKVSLLYFS